MSVSSPPVRPNVLYADPPWTYEGSQRTGGSMTSGSHHQYGGHVLSQKDLVRVFRQLDEFIVARDCVLALWATTAKKPEIFDLIHQAHFVYKTTFYWIKEYPGRQMGLGAWNRGGVEELLICIRGRVPAWRIQRPAWIRHPVLSHSRKPAIFRDMIRAATARLPEPRRVELFARRRAQGFWSTGLELDGRDIREVVATWPRT